MNLQELRKLLRHPKPNVRMVAIHVLGMVDEVRALPTIAQQVKVEENPKVAKELRAVGRHLQQLMREGYDTIEAICEHYNVYSDVLAHADEKEFKTIHNMASNFTKKEDPAIKDVAVKQATMLVVTRLVGVGSALSMTGAGVTMSSNLGSVEEMMQKQKKRIRPTIPTEKDITRWAKMLKSPSADTRGDALVQMNTSKNPKSLQYIAHSHFNDPDEKVRFRAKQLGRALYWNTIYYELEQSGRVEKIMQKFALSLGIELSEDATATQEMPMPEIAQESIEDILAKAEKNRAKHGRRR